MTGEPVAAVGGGEDGHDAVGIEEADGLLHDDRRGGVRRVGERAGDRLDVVVARADALVFQMGNLFVEHVTPWARLMTYSGALSTIEFDVPGMALVLRSSM